MREKICNFRNAFLSFFFLLLSADAKKKKKRKEKANFGEILIFGSGKE